LASTQCSFTESYTDIETGEEQRFECKEHALDTADTRLCIFHDENYLQDKANQDQHKKLVREEFYNKVKDSIIKNKAFVCIGYHLPDVTDVTIVKDFPKPVYFQNAKFYGKAIFRDAKFHGVSFHRTQFRDDANFRGACFKEVHISASHSPTKLRGNADFNQCEFYAKADFYGAKFCDIVDFSHVDFYSKASYSHATFYGETSFYRAKFASEARFNESIFKSKTNFEQAKFLNDTLFSNPKEPKEEMFKDKTSFESVSFDDGRKILFETGDLSKVSFMNADITRIRFNDKARWGEKEKDKFKVMEERWLENSSEYCESLKYLLNLKDVIKEDENRQINFINNKHLLHIRLCAKEKVNMATVQNDNDNKKFTFIIKKNRNKIEVYPELEISLGSIMAVYRNLRENYEFRLRYDEAGKFFIREMELKRKYREIPLKGDSSVIVKPNGWFRRNLSLTGLYYHLSRYGENLLRPTLIGMAIIFGSTLFWLMQSNPYAEPSLSHVIGLTQVVANHTQWQKAFERSFADFLPLLPLGSKIQMGLSDYVIKILGGALTFGFIAIALRRKFERKYTR
jgi:uncharacterized protein YjbI with pentapeptide repeats